MELFLLRHGVAVERGDLDFQNDAARPLTAKGKRQLRETATALRRLKIEFDLIWSSPLVRARQTAEIIAAAGKAKKRLVFVEELQPGGGVKKLAAKIAAQKPTPAKLLLVGHEPDLSELLSLLVTGQTGGGFALKKGGLARMDVEKFRAGKCATLIWLLTPKQLKWLR